MPIGSNGQERDSSAAAPVGQVQVIDIEQELKAAYLDYAMSVIVARALPDVRDGLKPVNRRILYAMYDMGLRSNTPYRKSARIVGEVLGKYHPHGDAAVYDAMARMAQDFSMRYPLVDGQGNFGSIDGDSPAAMRYTEARLAPIAEELLQDIEKDTVDWQPNFDGSLQEPVVLPARIPNLLINGAAGIAVGMATNIPPHNLNEVADALIFLIDHYDALDEVGVEEIMRYLPGPDFPTGAYILGTEGIKQAYATGRGHLVLRAVTEIEPRRGGGETIIIKEIPYQLNKSTLLERIALLVRNGRIEGISDLRDESDREGLRVVIEVKRGVPARKVLNQLYKYTPLQTTFGVQMLALVDGEPRLLPIKRILVLYIEHRRDVITRRTEFELRKAKARAHILEGLRIALQFLDEVIAIIRGAQSADAARDALMARFGLTEVQAQAILDMQLRRLAALERQKIEEEYQELLRRIAYLEDLLAHPKKILGLIREDLEDIKARYGDERRTQIRPQGPEDISEEDLIMQEDWLVTVTQDGYIKRTSSRAFRAQRRGGRGIKGMETREEDVIAHAVGCRSLDTLLFFTNQGRVYAERVYNVPEGGRTAKGLPLINIIALQPDEQVTALVAVSQFTDDAFITLCTRQGKVKRMPLTNFARVRATGLIAVTLEKGDELGWARITTGTQDLIVTTRGGRTLRFPEQQVRVMGRQAAGVQGIRLSPGDRVAGLTAVQPQGLLLVVTERGFGKRVPLEEIPTRNRGGRGVWVIDHKRLQRTGPVVSARVVLPDDEIIILTAKGMAVRMKVAGISVQGRYARGVTLISLDAEDTVAAVVRLPREEE